jgi:VIT1/CCC1 family predicted Fe2+/Mn2+ transporter
LFKYVQNPPSDELNLSDLPNAPSLLEVAKVGCTDEYNDYAVYKRLAGYRTPKDSKLSLALNRLAQTEYGHYEFWKKFIPDFQPKLNTWKVNLILLLRTIFGVTFAVRYLERHESVVIDYYNSIANLIPQEDKQFFETMLSDEQEHEKQFSEEVESSAVRYISFVVLGLADALVEITGIHAGSLGIYNSTQLAGLAGIIAGAAASLAMASAAFAQAKQGFSGSARLSAVYTGVSYFVTAVILASPYFLTRIMAEALSASLVLAVIIVALTTLYSSIISDKPFRRDFIEILSIMFGTTLVLYVLGYVIRVTVGITI